MGKRPDDPAPAAAPAKNDKADAAPEEPGFENIDPMNILHTGDIVLIKTSLQEDAFAEASDVTGGTAGYLTGDGVLSEPKVVVVNNFADDLLDFRDFLFVVVDQLSYRASKDLKKRKKHLAQTGEGNSSIVQAELHNLEERVRQEEKHNFEVLTGMKKRPLRYGDVVQLQHLRTQQYIGVKPKFSAQQQPTSRRVELQDGTISSWLHVNPFFSHRTQGEPVIFHEQVSLESVKLADRWNLNWVSNLSTITGKEEYEVNCAKGGRGFYFMLYSRAIPMDVKGDTFALSYALPLRLYNPHQKGCVAASCRTEKQSPYMRKCEADDINVFGGKDVWMVEPVNFSLMKDTAIEYSKTPVLLKHCGSGQYLAISEDDLQDQGVLYDKGEEPAAMKRQNSPQSPKSPTPSTPASPSVAQKLMGKGLPAPVSPTAAQQESVAAKLMLRPNIACVFTLEPASQSIGSGDKMYVPRKSPTVMIKWDRSTHPFWLGCLGRTKGEKTSLSLEWTRVRSSRDALRLDVLANSAHMKDCDTVIAHRLEMRNVIIPNIARPLLSPSEMILSLKHAERSLADMIFFLSRSVNWRAKSDSKVGGGSQMEADPFHEAWSADAGRQNLVRELKFIDETIVLFRTLAAAMPELAAGEVDFSMRVKGTKMGGGQAATARALEGAEPEKDQVDDVKALLLKTLVRLWLYCFLNNRESEKYVHRKGLMDIIDALNGRGLGASDVFVSLLSANRELVRMVKNSTVARFVNFIRILGPLDTWLNFLKALCDPQNLGAASDKQQLVLTSIAFQGLRAPEAERGFVRRNREELLLMVALQGPVGEALSRRRVQRQPDLNECLAPNLLAHGVHDVAICWTHPEKWEVGKGVLYHGPEDLGLPVLQTSSEGHKWVSLVQIAWVLQPDKCCQAVTGRTWEEMLQEDSGVGKKEAKDMVRRLSVTLNKPQGPRDAGNPFDVPRIDLLKLLSRYFQAQLKLVAALAKEQQMNSIMALQNEYTFSVCLSGAADPRLPASMRGAFFDLLSHLWVCRPPHEEVVVPRLMRPGRGGKEVLALPIFALKKEARVDCWSAQHAASLPAEVLNFYRLKTTSKFEALIQVVTGYLCAGSTVEHQVHMEVANNQLTMAVVQNLSHLLRFSFLSSFQMLQELQGSLLRLLDGRTDWLDPPQVTRYRRTSVSAGRQSMGLMPSGPSSEWSPLLEAGEPPRSDAVFAEKEPPADDSELRYKSSPENADLLASKVATAEIVLKMHKFGLDTQISQVLAKFEDYAANKITVSTMVEEVLAVMDHPVLPFEQPGVLSPTAMLVDLMMYQDSKLLPLALELLLCHCDFPSALLQQLEKVSLLSKEQTKLMDDIFDDISRMSGILYGFENWGHEDAFSSRDIEPFHEMQEIGKRIQWLCYGGNPVASGQFVQEVLRHTEFVAVAKYWLRLDQKDTDVENRELTLQLTAVMCSAAAEFCRGNKENQGIFLKFLPQLVKILSEDGLPECAVLISELFRNNMEGCQLVDEELIQVFGNHLVRTRRAAQCVPWHIRFFSFIVAVGSQPISRNQVLVIEALESYRKSSIIITQDKLEKLKELIPQFTSEEMLTRPSPAGWKQEDGELIYYIGCLDLLVGLATGRGNNLVNKPFVGEFFSAIHCLSLLNKIKEEDYFGIPAAAVRHLRTRWMLLLQLLLYDVDKIFYDLNLLASPAHTSVLEDMLRYFEALLDLGPVQATPREGSAVQSEVAVAPLALGQATEEHVAAMLICMESFFNGPYQATLARDDDVGGAVSWIGRRFSARFRALERDNLFRNRLPVNLRQQLMITGFRVLSAVDGKAGFLNSPQEKSFEQVPGTMSEDQVKWQMMLDALRKDERCQQRLELQDLLLGEAFLRISDLTDPENADYIKAAAANPPVVDYRRTIVTVQDAVCRLVKHSQEFITDLSSLRQIIRTMQAIVSCARRSGDSAYLATIQSELCTAGLGDLLVRVLDKHKVEDVRLSTWRLIGDLLMGMETNGQTKVNKVVQKVLQEVLFEGHEDVGLWESLSEIISTVGRSVKPMQAVRLLPVLSADEQARSEEYCLLLEQAKEAMEATRLMVEGHFKMMQDYLYSQEGNARSWNVPGLGCWLLTRLCKNSTAANFATDLELETVRAILALLTELAQGPNLRNQEFLGNMGLIEMMFSLLAQNFKQLQKAAGDMYPATVRELKAELMQMLLALLEGRMDSKIHRTMLERGDPQVVRERIMYVYLYFVFGSVAVSSGQVQSKDAAAVPLDGNLTHLMLPTANGAELFEAVQRDSVVAEELLEDLNDRQMTLLFSEGFYHVQLVLELSSHSTEFKKQVMPTSVEEEKFVDDPDRYRTQREYVRDLTAYQKRHLYRQSFEFLRRFVKTIEVVLHGHLQSIHFQTPITAMWYVQGASKQRILDEIPFSSPDIKMKAFVHMCQYLHIECQLILQLSRFSLLPGRYRIWAQRNIPDALHRPFFVFLASDARRMQDLLSLALWLSLLLAAHVGISLVPVKDSHYGLKWSSPTAERISLVLGGMHFACTMVWLFLYTCIKVPLTIRTVQHANPDRNRISTIFGAWVKYLSQRAVAWRCFLAITSATALFGGKWWVYSFLVADFFCQSSSLQTVLSGIVAPAQPLLMTFLGAGIVAFVYAAIGTHYFRRDFNHYCDENIFVCTESILYMSTRAGIIGLSSMMENVMPEDDSWYGRMTYDISYFVVFGIMLLNTIVALIVDSFQTQRREAGARERVLETQSFISCIDRKTIETVAQQAGIADGFDYHETYQQHKWDYMAFLFQLYEKDAQDYTGPEQEIRGCVDNNDVTWLPQGRSKMIEGKSDDSKEDTLITIERQNKEIIQALGLTNEHRQTLFKSLGNLARMMRDKTDIVKEQLGHVLEGKHGDTHRDNSPRPAAPAAASAPEPAPIQLDITKSSLKEKRNQMSK